MSKNVLHSIFELCGLVGLVIMAGTVGSADVGLISFGTLVVKSLISVGFMGVSYIGLKLTGAIS